MCCKTKHDIVLWVNIGLCINLMIYGFFSFINFFLWLNSGIFINIGKTLGFDNHGGSWAFFHCDPRSGGCIDPGSEAATSGAAARAGWDSLQYTSAAVSARL